MGMVIPASAAGTPTLSISSGEVKAGESVTLTVSIKDNPGIAASKIYVYFDTDTFEVDPSSDIEAVGKFGSSGGLIANQIDESSPNDVYDGVISGEGVLAIWYNNNGQNVTTDGEFVSITFRAVKNAANGDHTIKVGYSKRNTGNEKGETVSFVSQSGTIKVTDGSDKAKPKPNVELPDFQDVTDHWAESYIWQAAEIGLVEGYEGLYRPNDTMTRAEFVTILWRAMGEPKPSKKASFTDLTQEWYLDAVAWAEENSVVNGMGDGLFAPTGSVTREQLVTILHRLAGNPMGMELMLSGVYDDQYSDSGQIGDWAKASLYWSIYEGIYCGENAEEIGSTLAPKSPANRAQIAVMMIRYLNEQQ